MVNTTNSDKTSFNGHSCKTTKNVLVNNSISHSSTSVVAAAMVDYSCINIW